MQATDQLGSKKNVKLCNCGMRKNEIPTEGRTHWSPQVNEVNDQVSLCNFIGKAEKPGVSWGKSLLGLNFA